MLNCSIAQLLTHLLTYLPTYLPTYLLTYLFTYFLLSFILTYLLTFFFLTNLLTYLLTLWSRVLIKKLTGSQLLKKLRHFMKSEGSLPHSQVPATCPYPEPGQSSPWPASHFRNIHLIIILSSTLGSSRWSLSFRFPIKTMYTPLLSPVRATCPTYIILTDLMTQIMFGEQYWSLSFSLCSFLHSPVTSPPLRPNILLKALFSNTLSLRSSLNVSDQVSHPMQNNRKNYSSVCLILYIFG